MAKKKKLRRNSFTSNNADVVNSSTNTPSESTFAGIINTVTSIMSFVCSKKFLAPMALLMVASSQLVSGQNLNIDSNYSPIQDIKGMRIRPYNVSGGWESYTWVDGEVDEAEIVFLGEEHSRRSDSNRCVNKISKNRGIHVVNLEGVERGSEVKCSRYGIDDSPERKCLGSDDPDTVAANKIYYRQTAFPNLLKLIDQQIGDGLNDKAIDQLVRQFKETAEKNLASELAKHQYESYADVPEHAGRWENAIHGAKANCDAIARLLKLRKKQSYQEILKANRAEIAKAPASMPKKGLVPRTASLLESIKDSKLFSIFVWGSHHIVENTHPDPEAQMANEMVHELKDNLAASKKNYARLYQNTPAHNGQQRDKARAKSIK